MLSPNWHAPRETHSSGFKLRDIFELSKIFNILDSLYQGLKPLESIQLAPMIVSGYTIDPDNDITVTYTIKVSEERILSFTVMDDRTKKILIQDSGPILHKHR